MEIRRKISGTSGEIIVKANDPWRYSNIRKDTRAGARNNSSLSPQVTTPLKRQHIASVTVLNAV